MPYKAIIFDLDGTLIDSMADIADSVNLALVGMSLSPISPSQIADFVGSGVQALIQRALREATGFEPDVTLVHDTIAKYLEAYESHLLPRLILIKTAPAISSG